MGLRQSLHLFEPSLPACLLQPSLILCDPKDCSLPGSSVHGILQARRLVWVVISSSRASSQPRDETWAGCIAGGCFTVGCTREEGMIVALYQPVCDGGGQGSVQFSCSFVSDALHSTPGLPVHHQLLEFTQTHVHCVGDAIHPSHPLSSPFPPAFSLSQHQGLFQ